MGRLPKDRGAPGGWQSHLGPRVSCPQQNAQLCRLAVPQLRGPREHTRQPPELGFGVLSWVLAVTLGHIISTEILFTHPFLSMVRKNPVPRPECGRGGRECRDAESSRKEKAMPRSGFSKSASFLTQPLV